MANVFHCPACGARLDVDEGESTIQCRYCRNSIAVPSEFQQPGFSQASDLSPAGREAPRRTLTPQQTRLFLLLVGIFVASALLPMCVSLAIPALAISVGLLGGIVSVLLTLLGNLLQMFAGG